MGDSWVRLDQWDEYRPEFGVVARELNSKGGEDKLEIAPVLEVSRAKEGGPEPSLGEHPLCDRPRDRTLSRSGESIQPVDGGQARVARPEFDLVQNRAPGSLETTIVVAVSILSPLRLMEIFEDSCFSYNVGSLQRALIESKDVLTLVLVREVSLLAQL